MRRIVLLGLILSATLCAAQQPDVRLRLLSLYHLSQITVTPGANAQFAWGAQGRWQPLTSPISVQAHGSSVEAGGRGGRVLVLRGAYQIASAGRTQVLNTPVELSAHDAYLRIVTRLPMEDYVAAVLQGETAGNVPGETLKALAVAIRSYATRFRERHKAEGFDFCDTTHCQYARLDVSSAVRAAVVQTSGELLWDNGAPLAAYYHKDCGGRTEAASIVWPDQRSRVLTSRQDPYCVRVAARWHTEMTTADLDQVLRNAGLSVPRGWDRITIVERTPSGRVRTLRFSRGGAQGTAVSASTLRFAAGRSLGWSTLKSDWYEVSRAGGKFVFDGRGVGHGVGLCQTGASEMARQGHGYRDILAFYYPGAPIGRSAQGIPWKTVSGGSFDVRVVNPGDTATVQSAARSALAWARQRSGLSLRVHPVVEVFPSVSMFRDATGEPGWVAASARRERIRIEPLDVLRGRLENVLQHEFLHMLVEGEAKAETPLWFREGLVLYLGGEARERPGSQLSPDQISQVIQARRSQAEMQNAYNAAASLVGELDRQWGRAELMRWLRDGIPGSILRKGSYIHAANPK